jgi:hypothetical protein
MLPLRVHVTNPAAAVVDNAVDLHSLLKRWTFCQNFVTVDAEAGCVSYQQDGKSIICRCNKPQVQFVTVEGLPPSFVGVEQAQQVRRDALRGK